MQVEIHYCGAWNYKPTAAGLAAELEKEFGATVDYIVGSGGIYNVTVDGKLIFSKHKEERFPEPNEILGILRDWLSRRCDGIFYGLTRAFLAHISVITEMTVAAQSTWSTWASSR
jgi:selenoprotein W-related protein